MRALLREPFLHFLALGALIFGLSAWLGGEDEVARSRIELSSAMVSALEGDFERRNQRAPTETERQGLIDAHVAEEVLFREALAHGLDRGDPIIRRRLVQKMKLLVQDMEPVAEPEEAALQAYLDANRVELSGKTSYGLTHVFLSRDKHGESPDLSALLTALRAGEEPGSLGDPFPHGGTLKARSVAQLSRIFGAVFARSLPKAKQGVWTPIRSSYGMHLVRVDEVRAPSTPTLATVRAKVRNGLLRRERKAAEARVMKQLRARYQVGHP